MATRIKQETWRLFVGIAIPEKAQTVIQRALGAYAAHIDRVVPPERWHLTLLWLGECPDPTALLPHLSQPMRQQFLPTVAITHLGRGLARQQVWASGLLTPLLGTLRQELMQRIQETRLAAPGLKEVGALVPHVRVATLKPSAPVSLPDELASVTFTVPALHLYRSEIIKKEPRYSVVTSIPL